MWPKAEGTAKRADKMQMEEKRFKWAWPAALACFIVAGSTGSLLRFGMLQGFPAGLQMQNVRHAHSHLMYFGWVTPSLMALISAYLPQAVGRPLSAAYKRVVGSLFITALLAYVPFLLYGYRPVTIQGLQVPLSMIGASLNIVIWYAFVLLYVRSTRGVPRFHALRLWDAALAYLVLSSLGAWGLAAATFLDLSSPLLATALTRLFLDLFADGWFVLGLLGVAFAVHPRATRTPSARWGENLLVVGLPVTFLLHMPGGTLPGAVRLIAGAGGALVAVGLLANLWALAPEVRRAGHRLWLLALAFLGLKAVAQLVISFPAGAAWGNRMALNVSYLHWLLLGFVTLGLVAAAANTWGRQVTWGRQGFALTVLLLLASLIPLTRLWPTAWAGRPALVAAAWATVGPVTGAALMLLGQRPRGRRQGWAAARGLEAQHTKQGIT